MRNFYCILFLVFLAAVLVKSETTIEVDDNGDEYEVKRFNVQGRQLDGRAQCVVSRRKRSTATNPDEATANNSKGTEQSSQTRRGSANDKLSDTTAPTGVETDTTYDQDEDDYDSDVSEHPVNAGEQSYHHIPPLLGHQSLQTPAENKYEEDDDDDDDDDEPDGDDYDGGVDEVTDHGGVVVVQSHNPPVVDPNTHAVFELQPVVPNGVAEYAPGHDLDFEEEISPVSTTAIWSTGDDEPDDYDYGLLPPTKLPAKNPKEKPNRRPAKAGNKNKNKKKKNKNKNKKNKAKRNKNKKKKNSKRRKNKKKNKKRKLKKSRKSKKRNKRRRSNPVRVSVAQNNRRVNANLSNSNVNKKKKQDATNINQGTNTFTKTETMTQTGTANEDKDVNCIIIRKDPPPSQRPFWNILGRDAGNVRESGHFGKRKRVNFRLVA